MSKRIVFTQERIEALEKNEYGQYIVEGLSKFEKGALWRATEHPCSRENAYACLNCPYEECLAPAYITNFGNDFPPMYDGIAGAYEPGLPHVRLGGGKVGVQRSIVADAVSKDI